MCLTTVLLLNFVSNILQENERVFWESSNLRNKELNNNEQLILTTLYGVSELYDLQIIDLIADASNGEIGINVGSLYPLLDKLTKKGYVECFWKNKDLTKEAQKYYKITPTGTEFINQSQSLQGYLGKLEMDNNLDKNVDLSNDLSSLEVFKFEVVTVNRQGAIVAKENQQARSFQERLPNGVTLEMVYIPGGTIMMGTKDATIESLKKKYGSERFLRESPQHKVTVPDFYMGKYPITQEQWKAIASLDVIEQKLELEPSLLSGKDSHPVEKISWDDAQEFCRRLSRQTKKQYRLPSEAMWEYACRAIINNKQLPVTSYSSKKYPPFYFGETITEKLANYNASEKFANESLGNFRQITSAVGKFPPNAFGLYDMHGNVWEWCEDDWHEQYQNAPNDGSAWLSENSMVKVIRGGSWSFKPYSCRSAYRFDFFRDDHSDDIGFRVICEFPKTV